jgi:hypothetical protein
MQCADVRARVRARTFAHMLIYLSAHKLRYIYIYIYTQYMLTLAHSVHNIHCTVTICECYCLYMLVWASLYESIVCMCVFVYTNLQLNG